MDLHGITSGTFYGNLLRYFKAAGLPPSGVHIFRHSAAKLRREAGESVEQVSRFLDHSSLAVTTTIHALVRREVKELTDAQFYTIFGSQSCSAPRDDLDPLVRAARALARSWSSLRPAFL